MLIKRENFKRVKETNGVLLLLRYLGYINRIFLEPKQKQFISLILLLNHSLLLP
jgi:hypothetical protein